MIEENGRVVAVKGNEVWIETIRQSTCSGCSARSGCGQGLLAKVTEGKRNHIRIVSETKMEVGDQVVFGLPEKAFIRSSFWAYGMPLSSLILSVVMGDKVFGLAEPWVIAAAIAGLGFGFLLVKLHSELTKGRSDYQPVIVKATSQPSSGKRDPQAM